MDRHLQPLGYALSRDHRQAAAQRLDRMLDDAYVPLAVCDAGISARAAGRPRCRLPVRGADVRRASPNGGRFLRLMWPTRRDGDLQANPAVVSPCRPVRHPRFLSPIAANACRFMPVWRRRSSCSPRRIFLLTPKSSPQSRGLGSQIEIWSACWRSGARPMRRRPRSGGWRRGQRKAETEAASKRAADAEFALAQQQRQKRETWPSSGRHGDAPPGIGGQQAETDAQSGVPRGAAQRKAEAEMAALRQAEPRAERPRRKPGQEAGR